jgi:hypothetical protein
MRAGCRAAWEAQPRRGPGGTYAAVTGTSRARAPALRWFLVTSRARARAPLDTGTSRARAPALRWLLAPRGRGRLRSVGYWHLAGEGARAPLVTGTSRARARAPLVTCHLAGEGARAPLVTPVWRRPKVCLCRQSARIAPFDSNPHNSKAALKFPPDDSDAQCSVGRSTPSRRKFRNTPLVIALSRSHPRPTTSWHTHCSFIPALEKLETGIT